MTDLLAEIETLSLPPWIDSPDDIPSLQRLEVISQKLADVSLVVETLMATEAAKVEAEAEGSVRRALDFPDGGGAALSVSTETSSRRPPPSSPASPISVSSSRSRPATVAEKLLARDAEARARLEEKRKAQERAEVAELRDPELNPTSRRLVERRGPSNIAERSRLAQERRAQRLEAMRKAKEERETRDLRAVPEINKSRRVRRPRPTSRSSDAVASTSASHPTLPKGGSVARSEEWERRRREALAKKRKEKEEAELAALQPKPSMSAGSRRLMERKRREEEARGVATDVGDRLYAEAEKRATEARRKRAAEDAEARARAVPTTTGRKPAVQRKPSSSKSAAPPPVPTSASSKPRSSRARDERNVPPKRSLGIEDLFAPFPDAAPASPMAMGARPPSSGDTWGTGPDVRSAAPPEPPRRKTASANPLASPTFAAEDGAWMQEAAGDFLREFRSQRKKD